MPTWLKHAAGSTKGSRTTRKGNVTAMFALAKVKEQQCNEEEVTSGEYSPGAQGVTARKTGPGPRTTYGRSLENNTHVKEERLITLITTSARRTPVWCGKWQGGMGLWDTVG